MEHDHDHPRSGDSADDLAPPRMNVPWVESAFFDRELACRADRLTIGERRLAADYHDQGYVVLEQAAPEVLCERVKDEIESTFNPPAKWASWRVQDAWRQGAQTVRTLALLPAVQDLLGVLYERRPIPFQTLNFKWGTQQRGHADSIHFSSLPARYMCGAWVALEDVDGTNGPLFYHPGSHRLPEITAYDLGASADDPKYNNYEDFQYALMDKFAIEPVEFHAHRGDVLIWSSNIVHGGRPVLSDERTRWSQVTHYYFENCIYYTPMYSNIPMGELVLKDVLDLATMEHVAHTYNGMPLRVRRLRSGRSRVAIRPPPRSVALRAAVRRFEDQAFGRAALRPVRGLHERISGR